MDLLTSLMHHYCTNPAPITSQDTLILSHSFNLRLTQTLFIFIFFPHAVSIWNSLPYSIVLLPNISVFKKSFVKYNNLGTLYY